VSVCSTDAIITQPFSNCKPFFRKNEVFYKKVAGASSFRAERLIFCVLYDILTMIIYTREGNTI